AIGVVHAPALTVIARRDVFAAHEDLAIVGDVDLDAADRRAHRPLAGLERMVERDDRRGFGEAVALDHDKPEAAPELFHVWRQRRGTNHERPEFEPEGRVDPAIPPPSS